MPSVTRYKRKQELRTYNVLKPYAWSDVINYAFISLYNLPYDFIYKRAKVTGDTTNSNNFFTFHAKCKDREESFGWCNKKPKDLEPMSLQILTKDTRGSSEIHASKRPLMGLKRMKISEELSKDVPSNWRRQNVNNIEFGDTLPSNVYSNNTLSKAKQDNLDKKLGVTKNKIFDSLMELKHTSQAENIHFIACDPLLVHYWTNHQLVIYKDMNKTYCRLAIDATGSLVKKLKRTSR